MSTPTWPPHPDHQFTASIPQPPPEVRQGVQDEASTVGAGLVKAIGALHMHHNS